MGRPATGQTPVKTFRPPEQLSAEFEQLANLEGRSCTDALIEAMHDWIKKKRRQHPPEAAEPPPAEPAPTPDPAPAAE